MYDKDCNCLQIFTSESDTARALAKMFPEVKHLQSIVNSVLNKTNRRKVQQYKSFYLLRPDQICNPAIKNTLPYKFFTKKINSTYQHENTQQITIQRHPRRHPLL